MNKIRKIKFINHPVLNNMEFDFTGRNGNAVDTVIIAGENGCGKSTLINELYKTVLGQNSESRIIEYESDGIIYSIKTEKTGENTHIIKYFNAEGEQTVLKKEIEKLITVFM